MKKLILALTTLIAGFATQAYAVADWDSVKNLKIEMIEHGKQCKAEWMEHAKAAMDAKFDLLIKHHNEEADLKLSEIKSMPTTLNKEEWTAHCLQALKQHLMLKERQMADWARLHEEMKQSREALINKDKTAIEQFKQKLMSVEGMESRATTTSMGAAPMEVEELDSVTIGEPTSRSTATVVRDLK